jgi:transcriptional regulator with XRE-family HTH domain
MTTVATQADFARRLGVSRSHVTGLKHAGRLVLTDNGLVDVDASIARIDATRDPNRDDVANRHAAARERLQANTPPATPARHATDNRQTATTPAARQPAPPDAANHADPDESISYQAARTVKERYAAKTAKLEYERAIGLLVERAAVEAAVEDIMTTVRQSLEQQPHRLAPLLIGKDLDAIRATLRQETAHILGAMVADFAARLAQLADPTAP